MESTELTSPSPVDKPGEHDNRARQATVARAGTSTDLTIWALVATLIAGVVACFGGEAMYDFYKPTDEAASQPYAFKQLNFEKDIADGRNSAMAYGMLGAATGLALGLTAGFARRSKRHALIGGLSGLVLGGLAPALIAPWVVPLHRKWYWPETPDLKLPILVHGAMWCALGLGAGLAFGIGLGGRRRIAQAAIGGFIGALLATVLFDAVGAIAFAGTRADLPIADVVSVRILSRMLVATGVGLGASWAIREVNRKPQGGLQVK